MNKSSKHYCRFCSKEFETGSKLGGHTARCKMNPNYEKTVLKDGELKKGKHLSEETKNKISQSRIEYLKNNPDKVPYRLNHSSKKSWIEKIFEEHLIKNDIKGWVYNYDFNLYRLDFAFPEWKIDIELDGQTHQTDKVIKIDKRRNEFLKNEGWKIIRFSGKEIKDNIYNCIQRVCDELKNEKIIHIPKELLNKKFEKIRKEKIIKQIKEEKEKTKKENEKRNVSKILQFLQYNKNEIGIIQKLSNHLGFSHTTIRRIANRNNIFIFSRKGP